MKSEELGAARKNPLNLFIRRTSTIRGNYVYLLPGRLWHSNIKRIIKPILIQKSPQESIREEFLQKANTIYAKFKDDPQLWAIELQERVEWDATFSDGLE